MTTFFLIIVFVIYLTIRQYYFKGIILIGTINKKIWWARENLANQKYEIIHADQSRDKGINYVKSSKFAFWKFLKYFLQGKRVCLVSSNPVFLKKKWILIFEIIGIKVKNHQIKRSENILWVKKLSTQDALLYMPKYFEQDEFFLEPEDMAEKRKQVMVKELERYSDDRFLPEDFAGNMGEVLKHN